jgi:hypothetical protein
MQTCHSHFHSSAVVFSADRKNFGISIQMYGETLKKETGSNENLPFAYNPR